jgi:hypothetical protein
MFELSVKDVKTLFRWFRPYASADAAFFLIFPSEKESWRL